MAFFTIAFLWLSGLFLAGVSISIIFLFLVYRMDGGKRSFRSWFRAMRFQQPSPGHCLGLFCYALSFFASYSVLGHSEAIYGLFMPCPIFYHYRTLSAFLRHSRALQVQSILGLFNGVLSGFFRGDIGIQGRPLKPQGQPFLGQIIKVFTPVFAGLLTVV